MIIMRKYTFESAHFLPNVPKGHKCSKLHGHTYRLTVRFSGPLMVRAGWVMDFADVDAIMKPLIEVLDHNLLNEIQYLGNPTAERLARWIWRKVGDPRLVEVELWETDRGGVIYRGAGRDAA